MHRDMLVQEVTHLFRNIKYDGYHGRNHHHIDDGNDEFLRNVEVEDLWSHCLMGHQNYSLVVIFFTIIFFHS